MVSIKDATQRRAPIPNAPRIRPSFPCSPKAYWFELPDDSNGPTYPKGSRSVWDPDEEPNPGSIVLAFSSGEPIIGELSFETTPTGKITIVTPLNTRWAAARGDQSVVEILAVMTENTRIVPR